MTTIVVVHVAGDQWVCSEKTLKEIQQAAAIGPVILDLRGEGSSLTALGVPNAICDIGLDPRRIYVKGWSNSQDPAPFRRLDHHILSHFFWMSERYARDIQTPTHEYRYGMFCGRLTPARGAMIYQAWHTVNQHTLFSVMRQATPPPWVNSVPGIYLERLDQWISLDQQQSFCDWWQNCPISSLDNHRISDQYDPEQNTNRDLLAHYHKFDIEIVMETSTVGPAFFPTEKTVRPLQAGKAMLVYGPRGFLSNLRKLGFQTWHDHWDESYDDLEGPARWQTMLTLLKQDLQPHCGISLHNQYNLKSLIAKHRPG